MKCCGTSCKDFNGEHITGKLGRSRLNDSGKLDRSRFNESGKHFMMQRWPDET